MFSWPGYVPDRHEMDDTPIGVICLPRRTEANSWSRRVIRFVPVFMRDEPVPHENTAQ